MGNLMRLSKTSLRASVAAAALLALASGSAFAQDAGAPAPVVAQPPASAAPLPSAPGVIQRIIVQGNQRVDTETVLAYLSLRPGAAFDPVLVDQSLKTLFATNFFADVRFEQVGGDLIVRVTENPTVNQVLFEGNSAVKTDKLDEEVQIEPRSWYTQARVQADRRRILQIYRASGRFAAEVTPMIRELPQNRVDVIYEINEGPQTGIGRVNFQGNLTFTDTQLQELIVTEPSSWWRFWSNRDNFEAEKLEYDRDQLRKHYLNQGFYDFRVTSAVAELAPDQSQFFVTYTVNEGVRYEFGDITVNSSLAKLDPQALRAFVALRDGDLYRRDSVEAAVEALTYAAGAAGYGFVEIRPREVADPETRKVNIVFEVNEGPRVYIDRIDIVGNSATLDRVIRRELRLSEGDAFNRVLLDRSRNRVRALGFFADVEITEKPTSLPDRTVVEVRVEEQATGELQFGLGYSNADAYQVDVSITERNLRGRGQFLRFRVNASSRTNNVDIRFTEPRLFGRNLAGSFELFSVGQDYLEEAAYESQSTGLSLRTAFPMGEYVSFGGRYVFRNDSVTTSRNPCVDSNNVAILNPLDPRCRDTLDFTYSQLGYSLNWDRRDDPIRPTSGWDMSFSQDLAGIGTGVQFHRTEVFLNSYYQLFPGWVASASFSGGALAGYGGDTIRINDRFFKGGQTFRGFEIAGIGPAQLIGQYDVVGTDTNGLPIYSTTDFEFTRRDALGGNAYVISTLELTIPTPLPESYGIRASAFVDVGTVGGLDFDQINNFDAGSGQFIRTVSNHALRASAGLSVDWVSPFGPVRLDFSVPIEYETYDRKEAFRFSTSRRF
jgi:outer membrane protein insertion porin family